MVAHVVLFCLARVLRFLVQSFAKILSIFASPLISFWFVALFSCVVFSCENLLYSNDLCVQTTNIPSFVS